MSELGPDCVKHDFSWKGGAGSEKPISYSDRFHQPANLNHPRFYTFWVRTSVLSFRAN
jgi:hypothetical protein